MPIYSGSFKMNDKPIRGQIVRACLMDVAQEGAYKILARVEDGFLTDKRIYVHYLGGPPFPEGEFLVRLDHPMQDVNSDLHRTIEDFIKCQGERYAGYFLTSKVPDNFKCVTSDDLILYAIWKDYMKGRYELPCVSKIRNFYNPGKSKRAVYLQYKGKEIRAYRIQKGRYPYLMGDKENKPCKIGVALNQYLNHMEKEVEPGFPRLIIICEHIDLDDILLEFEKAKRKFRHKLPAIKLESQM